MLQLMQKILILIGLSMVSAGHVCAAEAKVKIKKIDIKKKTVTLKVSPLDGYEKGKRVCFFKKVKDKKKKKKKKKSKKSKKEKRIACGTINKVKPKKELVYVKVGKKKVAKISKSMIARLKSAGDSEQLPYDHGLKFYWLPHVSSPVAYNRLSYALPKNGEPAKENLWDQQGSTALGFAAGGFEYVMNSIGLGLGGRIRIDLNWLSETDYSQFDSTQYVAHSQSGQATGVWLMYYLLNGDFKLGLGVDYESATATLTSTWKNNDGTIDNPIYEVTSTLNTASLRIPLQYDIFIDPIGLSFGLHTLVPLSSSGSPTATVTDNNATNTSVYAGSDLEKDVIESLGHTKSSFGLDIAVGLFFGF